MPMIIANVQKMSLVRAARAFFYPNFITERVKAHILVDENFDLTETQRLSEKQKYDQNWEVEFSKFFGDKKMTLPHGYKNWVECVTSVSAEMEKYNGEVTKKQLLEDPLFHKFLKDTIRQENAAAAPTIANGSVRRDREELPQQQQQNTASQKQTRTSLTIFPPAVGVATVATATQQQNVSTNKSENNKSKPSRAQRDQLAAERKAQTGSPAYGSFVTQENLDTYNDLIRNLSQSQKSKLWDRLKLCKWLPGDNGGTLNVQCVKDMIEKIL